MSNCDKILAKARNSPNNFSFAEICILAECFGWQFRRQSSSHRIYENPKLDPEQGRVQNFQDVKGKSKPYQVRQLLRAIIFIENAD
jgi:hypothetical protein